MKPPCALTCKLLQTIRYRVVFNHQLSSNRSLAGAAYGVGVLSEDSAFEARFGLGHCFLSGYRFFGGDVEGEFALFDVEVMVSPSRTAAMAAHEGFGGYVAYHEAAGAPEKRPSVMRATVSLSAGMPLMAAVTASISRMPGPPRGPS